MRSSHTRTDKATIICTYRIEARFGQQKSERVNWDTDAASTLLLSLRSVSVENMVLLSGRIIEDSNTMAEVVVSIIARRYCWRPFCAVRARLGHCKLLLRSAQVRRQWVDTSRATESAAR